MSKKKFGPPVCCEHANETPRVCPCGPACYCKRPGGPCDGARKRAACDCGKVEHGRHHSLCPATGVPAKPTLFLDPGEMVARTIDAGGCIKSTNLTGGEWRLLWAYAKTHLSNAERRWVPQPKTISDAARSSLRRKLPDWVIEIKVGRGGGRRIAPGVVVSVRDLLDS